MYIYINSLSSSIMYSPTYIIITPSFHLLSVYIHIFIFAE